MKPRNRARSSAAALALSLAIHASPAAACGYHAVMSDLVAAHPRSIEVALAVRDALDRGELRELPALPSALGYLRASRLLRDFQPLASSVAGQPARSVAVLLVESGLWARYTASADGVSTEIHAAGPREGDRVIITSEAVLHALVDDGLDAVRAANSGVLLLLRQA